MEVVNFILANYESFFEILGYLVAAATVIVAFTKSNKDDQAVSFIKALIDRFSAIKDTEGVIK